jgi:peptide chain release factor 2
VEIAEARNKVEIFQTSISSFRDALDLEHLEESIATNENEMSHPEFWNDNEKAQKLIDENNALKSAYDTFHSMEVDLEEIELMMEMQADEGEDFMPEIEEMVQKLEEVISSYELNLLLNEPYDKNNAILEIHPGAGGTESQDWGSMLLRMYTRWADKHGFQTETLDYQAGDEAGVKSVTLLIKGHNAYGYLRSEKGVHRLVRISPFDSANRRHTSFCSIEIMPELDDTVEVEINPDDLKVDVYRASGAGGQHINKTSSAVRITHIPTGLIAASQAQRSQFKNRDQAMKTLKAKLVQLEMDKKKQEAAALKGEQMEIGWGSQIRSYVFHPYSMVKDHRTNYEVGNTSSVMDGDLDKFIDAYLKMNL